MEYTRKRLLIDVRTDYPREWPLINMEEPRAQPLVQMFIIYPACHDSAVVD